MKRRKWIRGIGILIIVALLVGSGIYYYEQTQKIKKEEYLVGRYKYC